ncbi:MAG: hypothetical protein WCC87_12055 [Candidatus Korobacteraceae bacterium]
MLDAFLVPANTVITAKGDSEPLDISAAANPIFLLTLSVTSVVEQEAIDISLYTSTDGAAWETKPVASLPQKFYVGEYPLLVDLSAAPGVKFIRAHWEVNRWGRGSTTPRFEIALRLREVSPQDLQQASAEAHSRR